MATRDPTATAPAAPARSAGDGAGVYALVRAQGRTIAVHSGHVRQAVEAPAELATLPRRSGGIEGVLTLGRRLLPVVSLARWIAPEAGADRVEATAVERARGLVLLLEDGAACIGLSIEAVVGVRRLAAGQVRRLFHDDAPDELFQSAALLGDDGVPTAILEPARLIALTGVWVADADLSTNGSTTGSTTGASIAATTAATAATPDGSSAPRPADAVPHATFRIGDAHVALPAAGIGELLRRPPLRHELPQRGGMLGLCEWRDRLVPVLDLAATLQAQPGGDDAVWTCIVRAGELALGIAVHEVAEIRRIAPDEGTPAHAPQPPRPVVARRLVAGPRTLQVLDVQALLERHTEAAISRQAAPRTALRASADRDEPAYMVFDAGGLFAARIDGVQEVVVLPDELRTRLDAGIATTLHWRQQPVPVVAIDDDLVTLPTRAARQLVVVRQGGRLAALPIAAVKALVPRGVARREALRLRGRPVEIISVETAGQRASYTVVDIGAALRAAA